MKDRMGAIAYHDRTKHTPESVRAGPGLDFDNKPRPFTVYEGVETIPLDDHIVDPELPALRALGDTQVTGEPADIETLASVCYFAAGVTKEWELGNRRVQFRAAACTGNLHHIDVYPVCGELDGLDAGVYHFDPRENSLDVLRRGEYRGFLANATGSPRVAAAPITLILTSTWWRNAWKYSERTFRHAFWDSGTMIGNLLATARASNVPAEIVMGFADRPIASLVDVDPTWEAPLELVTIGRTDEMPPATGPDTVSPIDPARAPLKSDPVDYPTIWRAWEAGEIPDGDSAAVWRNAGPRPVDGREAGDGPLFQLEPVDVERESARPLADTIRRRGSCREYERTTVSDRKLATVLDRAFRPLPLDARDPDVRAVLQFVDCYAVINDVADIPAGTYQFHPDRSTLEQLATRIDRPRAGHLALDQRLGADAAVCLYFMADLEAITAALGERGYRVAQLEAAATAGRLYLATYAHRDLGGTGLTFYDDEVTAAFEPRAADQTPMFLYTIGRPA